MTTLHAYQQRGVDWILDHRACGLFLPMGAGKTLTTIKALEQMDAEKILIVGPKRVIETTWPDEFEKWNSTLTYSLVTGTPKKRREALEREANVYLIGKDNVCWLVSETGRDWPFDAVVIDELSAFKNPQAKRFKALRTVIPLVEHFVGLTGTPSPKGIPDLWSQIYLMDRGQRLGKTLTAFRNKYLVPEIFYGGIVYKWTTRPGADKAIQEKISDICMSIDQNEYATLPDVSYIDIPVDLKEDLTEYKKFKKELLMEFPDDSVITADSAAVLCGKLSQCVSGAIYDESHNVHELNSHKLEALTELVEAANGQPVLIFYWYQHEKERIAKALKGFQGTDIKDIDAVKRWNAGELDYLLLQPASAGHGLNLQRGGHIAIWYSLPCWNLELYQQANARIYRQGQKEKVMIYHLLARNTIDEDMKKALLNKEKVQDAMLKALRRKENE